VDDLKWFKKETVESVESGLEWDISALGAVVSTVPTIGCQKHTAVHHSKMIPKSGLKNPTDRVHFVQQKQPDRVRIRTDMI